MRNILWFLIAVAIAIPSTYIITHNTGHVINAHAYDMTNEQHTFKKYRHMADAFFGKNAIDSVIIPIDPTTGNYVGNPTDKEFSKWLAECVYSPRKFTYTGYYETFVK